MDKNSIKIDNKKLIISIIYGLSNSIAMTVIGNLIGSTLDRIILNIKNKQNYHILPDKNDIFDKRTFSSISNLYNITSFIGGFLLHSTRIQNIHFITVVLLTIFVFLYNIPNIDIPFFDILLLMLSFIVFYCGSGFLTLIPIMNICQYWPEFKGFISSFFIIFGDFIVSVVIWLFYPKKSNNIALDNSLKIKYLFLILLYFIPISISTGIMYKFESDFDKDSKENLNEIINENSGQENNSINNNENNNNVNNVIKKRSKTVSFIKEFYTYDYWGTILKNSHVLKMAFLFFITLIAFIGCELIYSYSSYFKYIDYNDIKIDNKKFFQNFEYTRIVAWIGVVLFGYISDKKEFNKSVYIINLIGLIINIFILFSCIIGFKKTKFIFHLLEIIEYGLISGFFSIFLGKIMKVFKTSFLMEVTGIIAIAPLLVQMIRCIIQESINPFKFFDEKQLNANEFYDKCYYLNDKTTYCYFGAWIFFILNKSENIFIFSSIISIIFNIMALIIAQILITNEVGVIKEKMYPLDRIESFSERKRNELNNDP